MAKGATRDVRGPSRSTKARPYHCQLCQRALAEDELGYVCTHVAHGFMVTLGGHAPSEKEPLPDTPCTACDFAMEAGRENAETDADIHIVCTPCYREVRARNLGDWTEADRTRGYVLVPRAHYDSISRRKTPLRLGPIREKRLFKLGFSPIPSTHPLSLERMWVRVTCVLESGELHGALANEPELFEPTTLKADDPVVFTAAHVLDVGAKRR